MLSCLVAFVLSAYLTYIFMLVVSGITNFLVSLQCHIISKINRARNYVNEVIIDKITDNNYITQQIIISKNAFNMQYATYNMQLNVAQHFETISSLEKLIAFSKDFRRTWSLRFKVRCC